jgi:hypothetical protein
MFFAIAVSALSVQAQVYETKKPTGGPTRSVVNEDRGRACIVPGGTQILAKPSSKFIVEPQQYSIFLGKGWESDNLRAREPELANLFSDIFDPVRLKTLEQFGIKSSFSSTNYEEKLIDVGTRGSISDLQIQSILTDYFKNFPPARPGDGTTFVVYLDADTSSTMADLVGGKHYAAYHNAFNAAGMKIRYVVVPYVEDLKAATRNAINAFLSATYDPDCTS